MSVLVALKKRMAEQVLPAWWGTSSGFSYPEHAQQATPWHALLMLSVPGCDMIDGSSLLLHVQVLPIGAFHHGDHPEANNMVVSPYLSYFIYQKQRFLSRFRGKKSSTTRGALLTQS